eukprot:gene945-393_t
MVDADVVMEPGTPSTKGVSSSTMQVEKEVATSLEDRVLLETLDKILVFCDIDEMFEMTKCSKTLRDRIYDRVLSATQPRLNHLNVLFSLALMANEGFPPVPTKKRRTPAEITLCLGMSHRVPVVLSRLPEGRAPTARSATSNCANGASLLPRGIDKLSLTLTAGKIHPKVCTDLARTLSVQSLQSLTHLRLDWCSSFVDQPQLLEVASTISKLPALQELKWNMSEGNINNNSIEIIVSFLSGMKTLNNIDLDLGYPDEPFSQSDPTPASKSLKNLFDALKNMKKIDLSLASCNVSHEGVLEILNAIMGNHMSTLEEISLDLSGLELTSDQLYDMADRFWNFPDTPLNLLRMRVGHGAGEQTIRKRDLPSSHYGEFTDVDMQTRYVKVSDIKDDGTVVTEARDVSRENWVMAHPPPSPPVATAKYSMHQAKLPSPDSLAPGHTFCPSLVDDALLYIQVGSHVVIIGPAEDKEIEVELWQRPVPKDKRVAPPKKKVDLQTFVNRRGWVNNITYDDFKTVIYVYVSMDGIVYNIPVKTENCQLVTPEYRAWSLAGLNANCWQLEYYVHDLTTFRTNVENDSLVEPVLFKNALTPELLEHLKWQDHKERKAKFRRCFWAIGGDMVPTSGQGKDQLTQEDLINAELLRTVESHVERATGKNSNNGWRTSVFYLQDRDNTSPSHETDAQPVYNVHIDADPTEQTALARFLAAGDVMFLLKWNKNFFYAEQQITFMKFFYACKCMAPSAAPTDGYWHYFNSGCDALEEFSSKCGVINWWSLLSLEGPHHQLYFFPGHLLKIHQLAEYWAGFAGSARYLPPNFAPCTHRAGMKLQVGRGDAMIFDSTITPHAAGIMQAGPIVSADVLPENAGRKSLDFRVLQVRDEH